MRTSKTILSKLCIAGSIICLASWGWFFSVEISSDESVVLSTPIEVIPVNKTIADDTENSAPAQIIVTNNSPSPVRLVGFSAKCTCIERQFELPQLLEAGGEASLGVRVHLPLAEGGTPAHVYVEQGVSTLRYQVQFME